MGNLSGKIFLPFYSNILHFFYAHKFYERYMAFLLLNSVDFVIFIGLDSEGFSACLLIYWPGLVRYVRV